MPQFRYRGRDERGNSVNGSLEAADETAVADFLFAKLITPVEIASSGNAADKSENGNTRRRKVKLGDLVFFCRQMHTLLRAGVPILQALESLRQANPKSPLSEILASLKHTLNSGSDLSTALKRRPDVFSNLFISILQLGEASGNLPETFAQLATYLEQDQSTRAKIKAAVRYPLFVIIAISIALAIINMFVIPKFAQIFAKFNAELPLATKILLGTSQFTVDYWLYIVGALIAAFFLLRRFIKTEPGRYAWDKFKLRIPLIGPIFYGATLSRFTRAMALNMRAGVPWSTSMTMLSQAVDNAYIGGFVIKMREGVEQGDSITHTAQATGLFPPLVLQMMAVGEQTGAVDQLMMEVAEYYEREVDYGIKTLSASIEPILTIAIGILVLVLALGVFMPMWNLANVATGKQ